MADEEQNAATDKAEKASMENISAGKSSPTPISPDIEIILDIPVSLSIEVGRTRISIRELLQLGQGSVVELDRLEGEPLDVLVNGTLIAHGEVVIVNDNFGIRLTDIINQNERIEKIREQGQL